MSLFVRDAAERAIKTFVQAFIAAMGGGSVFDWDLSTARSAAIAAVGAALSVVFSLVSARFGTRDSASLVR